MHQLRRAVKLVPVGSFPRDISAVRTGDIRCAVFRIAGQAVRRYVFLLAAVLIHTFTPVILSVEGVNRIPVMLLRRDYDEKNNTLCQALYGCRS